jgi:prepilin-type processing-associated H-X9-DG protein
MVFLASTRETDAKCVRITRLAAAGASICARNGMALVMLKGGMALHSRFSIRRQAGGLARVKAYTLIDVFVFLVCLAVLGSLVVPSFLARTRRCGCRFNCTNKLKQAGLAFKQWALDQQDRFPMQVSTNQGGTLELVNSGQAWVHFQVMSNELNTPAVVFCTEEKKPTRKRATSWSITSIAADGTVVIPFNGDTNVSYFVGVDASDTFPNMWLAGDANFTAGKTPVPLGLVSMDTNAQIRWSDSRHGRGQGYFAFADGSVQQRSNAQLIASLCATGNPTNRLAMP